MNEQHDIITAFSEMAPRYERLMNDELYKFWGFSYEGFLNQVLSTFDPEPGDLILDIATGTGFIPGYLAKERKKFGIIVGLDITFKMLQHARRREVSGDGKNRFLLVCASAHEMPFKENTFDRIICCLATHHMQASALLNNVYHVLKPGGRVVIADAGGSSKWKNLIIKSLVKAGAYVYFLLAENYSRAVAESSAIANIYTSTEWAGLFATKEFHDIHVQQLKSRRFYAPDPMIIKAQK